MARLASKGRSASALLERVGQGADGAGNDAGPMVGVADRLDVWQLPSMEAAAQAVGRRHKYMPPGGNAARRSSVDQKMADVSRRCMGDPARAASTLAESDRLIELAIAHDNRLGRRSRWHRGEEGEIGCPALIAMGDDAPCFHRKRREVSEANGGEPVRIVISTDSNDVAPGTAAAFIATVRLVQQWRSVEVFWQGAWLNLNRSAGWVFHVPLVSGDMDYTRLDYCISDPSRDTISYSIMMTRACEVTKRFWNGCSATASYSHLPGESHFVPHTGIEPEAWSIAWRAARWLGWESAGMEEYEARESALQILPVVAGPADTETPAQAAARRKRWEEDDRRRERETAAAAAKRAASLSRNY